MIEYKRNTKSIVQLAKEKSKKTKEKVDRVISQLALSGETINFNTVSKVAEVSKSWLYKQEDVRERIELLRGQQIKRKYVVTQHKSPRSEEVLIKTLKNRLKVLEEENKIFKKQIQELYGQVYSQSN
ncbi:transposase [Bacillus cereus]|nr:transposase [Bacillus cereus]